MSPRIKGPLVFLLKAGFSTALIVALVRSGALDFGALAVVVRHPWLLALNLALFASTMTTATLRWRALLGIADVNVSFRRLLQLQLAAAFFNVVIPGGKGGDVMKALYVAREAPANKRATILLVVFVDAIVGLVGLSVLAGIAVLVRADLMLRDSQLRQLAFGVAALCALTLGGPVLFVFVARRLRGRLEVLVARLDRDVLTSGPSRVAKFLNTFVAVHHLLSRLLSTSPTKMLLALSASMAGSAANIFFFALLARIILDRDVAYSAVAIVFPLGVVSTIVPVAPAGLGVGHVAFDWLFSKIGVAGGATIFNVYVIGQIFPCFLGVFAYLGLRRRGPLPSDQEGVDTT